MACLSRMKQRRPLTGPWLCAGFSQNPGGADGSITVPAPGGPFSLCLFFLSLLY